ncbi:uncharacterized protein LOC117642218 [Thrips palmi]|uniref:Uncharacterized protein LOC117642218 n=1 Tax=Thrips palmi TaxID=161013 RepID=A0A6P8YPM4_THRPL|nr:uncharacterized protein LOC117642218 [Thrips palmi]
MGKNKHKKALKKAEKQRRNMELEQLERAKAQLLEELQDVEGRLRIPGDVQSFDPDVLSSMIGYTLSDFKLIVKEDKKIYSAFCYPLLFHMTVTCKEYTVLDINLVYFKDSPLHEINTYLLRFTRELCPSRVLFIIQQFDQLFKFREKVFTQLDGRCFWRTVTQEYDNELGHSDTVCNIEVYKKNFLGKAAACILEMQWRFSWNKPCQSMVNQFIIMQAVLHQEIETFTNALLCTVFFADDSLMKIWCNFNEWVSCG